MLDGGLVEAIVFDIRKAGGAVMRVGDIPDRPAPDLAKDHVDNIRTSFICNDSEYFLRHRRQVADTMAQAGHDVTVITGGPPIRADRIGDWKYENIHIERFSFHPPSDCSLFLSSLRHFARVRPRQVQLITLKPAVFSGLAAIAARLAGRGPRRIVVTIPGLGRLMSPASAHGGALVRVARGIVGGIVRFLSRRPGVHFVFETADDRLHWLSRGYIRAETSLVVSGAGVDPARFHPPAMPPANPRMRVLFASRLLRAKGLDDFIAAARVLGSEGDVEFVVAGMVEPHDPDGYPPALLEQEPAITFLGEEHDMPGLLRGVDVVCLPTRYGEGIPRILIEAAATGLPSIASDIDGCTHIVEDDVSGIIVPLEPAGVMAARLAEAVRRYRDDPALRKRHGEAAHRIFREGEFDEEAVTGRIIGLLTGEDAARAIPPTVELPSPRGGDR